MPYGIMSFVCVGVSCFKLAWCSLVATGTKRVGELGSIKSLQVRESLRRHTKAVGVVCGRDWLAAAAGRDGLSGSSGRCSVTAARQSCVGAGSRPKLVYLVELRVNGYHYHDKIRRYRGMQAR